MKDFFHLISPPILFISQLDLININKINGFLVNHRSWKGIILLTFKGIESANLCLCLFGRHPIVKPESKKISTGLLKVSKNDWLRNITTEYSSGPTDTDGFGRFLFD
jgi:hypothetical protein